MCPCAFPGRPPAACLCNGGSSSPGGGGGEVEDSPGRTRGGGGGGGGGGGLSGASLTASRLKAIGDELQARTAARRGRRASAGTGLATSLALLAALAWLSRRGRP